MNAPLARAAVAGPFTLPPLPWARSALEPVISKHTVELHYGKHHRGYVEKLNELVAGTDMARLPLPEIVERTHDNPSRAELFNNASQALNHAFYWESLAPKPEKPSEALRRLLERDFGGYEAFLRAFTAAATGHFGSGWAWLVANGDVLEIVTTPNAHTPVAHGLTPLLTVDVWEHAYYVDYQNRRDRHVKAVVEKLLNWEFAAENFARR